MVTLTSYPARIGTVHRTVTSLLRQQVLAQVVLYLAETEFPGRDEELPPKLRALAEHNVGVFCIRWVPENTRSYKKLVPALGDFPDRSIVTADDDVLYPPAWLSTLTAASRENPGVIVGTRGRLMQRVSHGGYAPYLSWPAAEPWHASTEVFLTGRGGILYPPGSLADVAQDMELAQRLAPTADDVWFRAAATLAGTPALVVPIAASLPSSGANQATALLRINNRDPANPRNDPSLAAVYHELDLL